MPALAYSHPPSAMKRPLSTAGFGGPPPSKKMKTVTHSIRNQQPNANELAYKIQDESVMQKQLIRSIALGLSAVGYDEVTPIAMESFRAKVDDCKFDSLVHSQNDFLTLLKLCLSSSKSSKHPCNLLDDPYRLLRTSSSP